MGGATGSFWTGLPGRRWMRRPDSTVWTSRNAPHSTATAPCGASPLATGPPGTDPAGPRGNQMATAEINELFEEGITRCRELSDEADEAMNAIDRMAERAEALTRRVEEEGEEACRRLRELTHALEEAGTEVESSTSQAVEALAGFDTAADGLRGSLADLTARIESALAEVAARKDDVERTVDAQMDSVRDAF